MRKLLGAIESEVPDQLAFPGELLNPAADAGAGAEHLRLGANRAAAQYMSVVEEVWTERWRGITLPRPHDFALHIKQMGPAGTQGRHQVIALKRPGIVDR